MFKGLIVNRIQEYKVWWHKPAIAKDRITSTLIGAIGGFWIGLLVKGVLTHSPIPVSELVMWGVYRAFLVGLLGILFPKIIGTMMYPFSMILTGSS